MVVSGGEIINIRWAACFYARFEKDPLSMPTRTFNMHTYQGRGGGVGATGVDFSTVIGVGRDKICLNLEPPIARFRKKAKICPPVPVTLVNDMSRRSTHQST